MPELASPGNRPSLRYVVALLVLTCLALSACSTASEQSGPNRAKLEPAEGAYFGVNLDFGNDSAGAFNERLGRKASVYVQFVRFPLDASAVDILDGFIDQVKGQNGIGMITLEPLDGLDLVTPEAALDLAERAGAYNESGVPLFVRFGHEMNGSWYPWSQQPTEYVRTYRLLAEALHEHAPDTATIWAPNYGGGYPFSGGVYEAKPDSPDFALLDTNGDGQLSMEDDMYAPYYPGDDVVDWVGMSVYHWGDEYPWGENEVPEDGKFVNIITGAYAGRNGDDNAVPDFYNVIAVGHNKPMAITETAALYNTTVGGDDEMAIKQRWWRQVFAAETALNYPQIKMINWFEWQKAESEIGGTIIDWRATSSPEITRAFTADLPDWLIFAR